jgi:L-lactate dehydrogenase complex protein LldF
MSHPEPRGDHAQRATVFVADDARAHWHDRALWFVRSKRDRAAGAIPEWEQLRVAADAIKAHTVANLPSYLEAFERQAQARGAHVHFARDAAEHNQIVLDLLAARAVKRVVKSKSMLTEECHLNPFLERHGIEVVDTDLGERIVQLRHERPSHIVLPAIHLKKEDVGETFHTHLGTQKGASDPKYLAEAARGHLRRKFIDAQAGITGVNFAVAETGGVVVCTNEGNADLGVLLPRLHIACMGMEKLIPRAIDLPVFLRLLARSATGQPVTSYTSHFHGPRPGCELHIVIVDNGRTRVRASAEFRRSLNCIRCGACMNTCPVYRRSGGHSYGATVPGPIGSILSPAQDPAAHASLPFACSLCGSCTDVCPVKIDLHHQLYTFRRELALKRLVPWSKRAAMRVAAFVLGRTWLYRLAGGVGRWLGRRMPRGLLRANAWGRRRDLPPLPAESFRAAFQARERAKTSTTSKPNGGPS